MYARFALVRVPARAIALATVLLLGVAAHAQNLNIDVGCTASLNPPAAYPGAAAQPGFWNWVSPVAGSTQGLFGLGGGGPAVASVTLGGGQGCFMFDNPGTLAGDELLMDDLQDVGPAGSVSTWTFTGLDPGGYWVYTYAWAPDNPAFRTRVHIDEVAGATDVFDPDQTIGGAWPGAQLYQRTFTLHFVVLSPGANLVVRTETPAGGGAGSVNGFQLVFNVCDGEIHEYCTAKVNSAGCTPDIATVGVPSVSAGAGFHITASNELCNKTGFLIFSLNGPDEAPFFGGTRCISSIGIRRTPPQNSLCAGGEPCGGHYDIDFNAYVATTPATDALRVPGTSVWAQYYSRDPGFAAPNNIGLTNAVRFTMCF